MAERIHYDVPPARSEPDAREALDTLLASLHQHGFLRLANDVVCANSEIAQILVAGLNRPGAQAALQNISLLFMALSQVPPERFNQLLLALAAGANAPDRQAQQPQHAAPGIRGALRWLKDEQFWQGIAPLLAGLRAFTAALDEPADKPITRYSGKPTHG